MYYMNSYYIFREYSSKLTQKPRAMLTTVHPTTVKGGVSEQPQSKFADPSDPTDA